MSAELDFLRLRVNELETVVAALVENGGATSVQRSTVESWRRRADDEIRAGVRREKAASMAMRLRALGINPAGGPKPLTRPPEPTVGRVHDTPL